MWTNLSVCGDCDPIEKDNTVEVESEQRGRRYEMEEVKPMVNGIGKELKSNLVGLRKK